MDPRTSIPGNRYDYGFTTATTATLSRVTMGVPAGTTGANRYLALNGVNYNYASTPSSSANFPSGDIDFKAKFSLATFPPSVSTPLLGKDSDYRLSITTNGNLQLVWVDSSGTTATMVSNSPLPITPNGALWIRAAFTVGGGSSHSTKFYTSTDGTNWVQFGTTITASSSSSTPNTNVGTLSIGARSDGTTAAPGRVYFASLANVINGTTSSPTSCGALNVTQCFNPNNDTIAGTSWAAADTTAETWTVNRSGTNLPADVASDLSVMNISGLPAGGTAQNREIDGIATYVLPAATSVPVSTAVSLGLAGFTNSITAGSYTSAITTYDNGATPVFIDTASTASTALTFPTIATSAGMGNVYPISAGPVATSSNSYPEGIAVNGNTVYISEVGTNTVNAVNTSTGLVTRYAGNGLVTSNSSTGTATSTPLSAPENLSLDASGNLYIAERNPQLLRQVNTSGTISTVAGASVYNFSGDGSSATSAGFRDIMSTVFNASGDYWIADRGNCRIRKVDHSTNVINTVAGNGTCTNAGDGGAATSASLNRPSDVAVDAAGNLYIADTSNNLIRKVDTSGNISTIAGTGSAAFSGDGGAATSAAINQPSSVAVDSGGNVYISDTANNRIRKVNTSGIISTIAGTGTASFSGDGGAANVATIWSPLYLKVDTTGNIFFSDRFNFRVRKINTSGIISTIFGTGAGPSSGDSGPATSAGFYGPGGMTSDTSGNVYVADTSSNVIRKIDQWGTITSIAGKDAVHPGLSGDGSAATSALLNNPKAVAVASNGTVYIADYGNSKIRAVTSGTISTLASLSGFPIGVAVNPVTQDIWTSTTDCRITKITSGGVATVMAGTGTCSTTGDGAAASSATVNNPGQMAFNSTGDLYFLNGYSTVRKISASTGFISTVAGGGASTSNNVPATTATLSTNTYGLTVDAFGTIFVANQYVVRSFVDGGYIQTVSGSYNTAGYAGDGSGGSSVRFQSLAGIALSQGKVYLADAGANNIRKLAAFAPVTPLVNNDSMSVPMNTTRPWPILSNDWSQSYEMDPSSVTITSQPAHGAVTITNPTTEASTLQANYTPTTSYTGSDSFTYQACDTTRVLCNTATVNVTVGSNQVMTIAGGPAEGYATAIGVTPGGGVRFRNYIFYTDSNLGLLRRYDLYSKQSVVVAGNETGLSSDGLATASGLANPVGVAITPDGTIAIAAQASSKVRQLSTSGTLSTVSAGVTNTTGVAFGRDGTLYATATGSVKKWNGSAFVAFAGNGTLGASGNGGASTSALVNTPYGLYGASNGDIYFSDSTDCTVRKVNSSGIISAVAGVSGTCAGGGNGGGATAAYLSAPKGISMDGVGNLLITDSANHAVRSVNTSGIINATVVANNSGATPIAVVGGSSTDFFYFDSSLLEGFSISTASVSTLTFGSGQAVLSPDGSNPFAIDVTTAQSASGIVADNAGNVYFSQPGSLIVRKIVLSTGAITTVLSGYNVWAMAIDTSNRLVFTDYTSCKVIRLNADQTLTVIAGTGTCSTSGDNGLATSAALNRPSGLAIDTSGNTYVSESSSSIVRKINAVGYVSTFAGKNAVPAYAGDGGIATSASLNNPGQLAIDRNGNLLIVDVNNYRIRMVDRNGIITTVAGAVGLGTMRGIAVDSNNNIFVSDTSNNRIQEILASSGVVNQVVGTGTASFVDNTTYTNAGLNYAGPLALDSSGNLFFIESNNHRLRQVTSIGATTNDALTSSSWNVVPAATGHTNLRETFVTSPSITNSSSKMTFTMPTSIAGTSLSVVSQYGVTGTATASLSGTTLTVSYPLQSLTAGVPIGFAIEGWTNGGANGAYASYVTEYDSAGTTAIGWAHSNVVNITSSGAPTSADAGFGSVWQRNLATTASAFPTVAISPAGMTDSTSSVTLTNSGNLNANIATLSAATMTTGTKTITPITADSTASVASASFATNRWGLQFVTSTGANSTSGTGYFSGLTSAAIATGTGATNVLTVTPRAKIDYLQPAGTYKSTVTWRFIGGV